MVKRWVLGLLAVSSLAILVASLAGGTTAQLAFAYLAAAFPAGLMLLGIDKNGRPGAALWPVLALLLVLVLAVAGMLAFRGQIAGAPRLFGLPPAAAVQLFGLFLAPLVVVALGFAWTFSGFAWTFSGFAPTRAELEKLRELRQGRRGR